MLCSSRPSSLSVHCARARSRGHLRTVVQAQAKEEDSDLVTRWVGKLFGQQAIDDRNPGGLKRVDWDKIKDWRVEVDKEAALRPTDDPLMQRLRPLLGGTQLEEEDLRMAYSATEDGWNPSAFHERVDGYGAALVYARTEGGAVLGGYNPLGYDGYGQKATMGAFLYTWSDGDFSKKPHKLPKIETDQLAILDSPDAGPHFGPGDLKILLNSGSPTRATCKLIDYQRLPGGGKSLFNVAAESATRTELVELKVFVRKGGKLKYELDGLRWKSSYAEDGSGEGPPPGIFTM